MYGFLTAWPPAGSGLASTAGAGVVLLHRQCTARLPRCVPSTSLVPRLTRSCTGVLQSRISLRTCAGHHLCRTADPSARATIQAISARAGAGGYASACSFSTAEHSQAVLMASVNPMSSVPRDMFSDVWLGCRTCAFGQTSLCEYARVTIDGWERTPGYSKLNS